MIHNLHCACHLEGLISDRRKCDSVANLWSAQFLRKGLNFAA